MSLEQAITDHAAAIRELAAAISGDAAARLRKAGMMVGIHLQEAMESGRKLKEATTDTTDTIGQDVTKVETDAKAQQEKVMKMVEADRKSAAKQAVADALAKAEAEKAKPVEEDDPLDAAPLDWDKDVRPALLAVGKDRDALVKLMAKYDVPKGGKAPAEKWADLLAEANAIVAARG